MDIRTATALIGQALEAGQIDRNTAIRAQAAVRERTYYGSRMTGRDRARIVNVRFGIVDTAAPVAALLARAGGAL